ncbi:tripartite tricarboxylate transporter substrate-binding protein [Dankookia sp. P2]|uniref:tripartite tricarboxylate transporter substrate-binding protein n=1 Tax=Dankookia sp. P2 TaxID=3423955 RepID=UPI003D6736C2
MVVENRSGAAGAIGTEAVVRAAPDGQTWLLTFDSHAVLPALLPNLPFNLTRDLDPVMLIGGAPYVIAFPARPALPGPRRAGGGGEAGAGRGLLRLEPATARSAT